MEGLLHFILGGNKSGKSALALEELRAQPGPAAVVVTARALDPAFRGRIAEHRVERGPDLPVFEAGDDLTGTLRRAVAAYPAVLADGLDYWVLERMQAGDLEARVPEFLDFLAEKAYGHLILVSVEIGLGPLAPDSFTRSYVRALGALNRRTAALSGRATLVAAGLPLRLR